MTVNEVFEDICGRPWLRGVTFSGGEPFEQVTALLDLADILKTPARQLSLGQRMRCEVAASLLN